MELPRGHVKKYGRRKVWCSATAIYGLSETPLIWHKTIHNYFHVYGFRPLISEPCLYVLREGTTVNNNPTTKILQVVAEQRAGELDQEGSQRQHHAYDKNYLTQIQKPIAVILLLYVDDISFPGQIDAVGKFKRAIQQSFKVKIKEKADSFIGIQLEYTKNGIPLHQRRHISKAVEKFEVAEAKREHIPIDTQTLEVGESPIMSNRTMYQSLVGLLNYLSQCTRPDIAFATSYLVRHLKEPRVAHLKKGKKCLVFRRDSQQRDYYSSQHVSNKLQSRCMLIHRLEMEVIEGRFTAM